MARKKSRGRKQIVTAAQKAARRKNIAIARKARTHRKSSAMTKLVAKGAAAYSKKRGMGPKKGKISKSSNWLDNMEKKAKKAFKKKQKYNFKGQPISQKQWEKFNK